jgi:hypothetical protein
MSPRAFRFTRRSLGLALVGAGLAPRALAAPGLAFPLRLAYVRVTPEGFAPALTEDKLAWSALQTRTGALIDEIEPLQFHRMLGVEAPELDGGAACALAARKLAADAGFDHVLLYATDGGKRAYAAKDNWFSRGFASLRSNYGWRDRATGEAHLLDVAGGAPLLSATSDAVAKSPLNPFDNFRNPERESLVSLTEAVERRLQLAARAGFEAQRSIAD